MRKLEDIEHRVALLSWLKENGFSLDKMQLQYLEDVSFLLNQYKKIEKSAESPVEA